MTGPVDPDRDQLIETLRAVEHFDGSRLGPIVCGDLADALAPVLASMRQQWQQEVDRLRSELGTALKLNGHLLSLNDQLRSERDQACALAAQRHTDLTRLRQLVQQVRNLIRIFDLNAALALIDESGLLGQTSNEETA